MKNIFSSQELLCWNIYTLICLNSEKKQSDKESDEGMISW